VRNSHKNNSLHDINLRVGPKAYPWLCATQKKFLVMSVLLQVHLRANHLSIMETGECSHSVTHKHSPTCVI